MSHSVFFIVLFAALLDALLHSWLKASKDASAMAIRVAIMGGFVALPVLAMTGLPAPASFPWLVASVLVGCSYWLVVGWSYRENALAVVFPVSRGAAVLMTTLGAWVFLYEPLSLLEGMMVLSVIGGLAVVAVCSTRGRVTLAAIGPSLVVAAHISAYTLIDTIGVRASGSPAAYCAVIFIGVAVVASLYAALFERPRLALYAPTMAMPALALSGLSMAVYTMVLYALTRAPVALVAALAESSIVFAALFGVFWLREPVRPGHLAGIAVVAFGVAFLRLAP